MSCQWRDDNGRPYLHADYTGDLSPDEPFRILARTVEELRAADDGARLLIEVGSGRPPSSEFLDAVKRAVRDEMTPRRTRVAFIGITGMGRIVLRGLQLVGGGFGAPAFPSREQALAYLFKER